MDNNIYINKCYAIVKSNDHTRCKSITRHNSIFCGVHKRYKPKYVAVILLENNDANADTRQNHPLRRSFQVPHKPELPLC